MNISELKPEAPDWVAVGWITDTYELAHATVYHAIRTGRLPAIAVPGRGGAPTYIVSPDAAFALWGAKFVARQLAAATDTDDTEAETVPATCEYVATVHTSPRPPTPHRK